MFYNEKREFLFGRQSYFRIYVKNLLQTDNFEEKFYLKFNFIFKQRK